MTAEATPVTSRRELARTLRGLRLAHLYSLEDVHEACGISVAYLSRVERGLRGLKDEYAVRLCNFYRVPPATEATLRQLARRSLQRSWWDDSKLPPAIREYIGVEQVATMITSFGSIVPGLFQTQAYASAMTYATDLTDSARREAVITHRLRRQEVLDGDDPPWVRAVLDEAALHRTVGGPSVQREQLMALVRATERPRVSIQVMTFGAGAHPGVDSRFAILATGEDQAAELVHVDGLSGYRNYDKPDDIGRFGRAWSTLSSAALPVGESTEVIRRIARSLTTH